MMKLLRMNGIFITLMILMMNRVCIRMKDEMLMKIFQLKLKKKKLIMLH